MSYHAHFCDGLGSFSLYHNIYVYCVLDKNLPKLPETYCGTSFPLLWR